MYFIKRAKKEMERWFIQLPDQDLAYLVHELRQVVCVKG